MKVRVSNPMLVNDLASFLVRATCDTTTKGATVDVSLPHAATEGQARLYLDLCLKAWSGLNPNVELEVVYDCRGCWPW